MSLWDSGGIMAARSSRRKSDGANNMERARPDEGGEALVAPTNLLGDWPRNLSKRQ